MIELEDVFGSKKGTRQTFHGVF